MVGASVDDKTLFLKPRDSGACTEHLFKISYGILKKSSRSSALISLVICTFSLVISQMHSENIVDPNLHFLRKSVFKNTKTTVVSQRQAMPGLCRTQFPGAGCRQRHRVLPRLCGAGAPGTRGVQTCAVGVSREGVGGASGLRPGCRAATWCTSGARARQCESRHFPALPRKPGQFQPLGKQETSLP